MKPHKIIVIGGGAAGMTAAIAAKRANPQVEVYILEHKDTVGKKILSTGNGRCNFTNDVMNEHCFFSDEPEQILKVLERFGTKETLQFFEGLGILAKSRKGYYYPRSDQASAILQVLKQELKYLGVFVETKVHVIGMKKSKSCFRIFTDSTTYEADRVILACGGRAASVLGSDGSGYDLAKSMGHSIAPVVPALVQLKVENHPLSKASGVRTDAKVSFYKDGKFMAEDTGELQITAYGISGIPVFQISRHVAKALYYKRKAEVHLDLLANLQTEEVEELFYNRKSRRQEQLITDFFVGIFNQKLISPLLMAANIRDRQKVKEIKAEEWNRLIRVCKDLKLSVSGTNGFEHAQVCAGGVKLNEINTDTMESLLQEGLYLSGELLDVDGICGGYNLQWAWASGYVAGSNASN